VAADTNNRFFCSFYTKCVARLGNSLQTGWVTQLNGDATFGFYRAELDMIELGFNSLGAVTAVYNPACW
jgi:hypothetical protein